MSRSLHADTLTAINADHLTEAYIIRLEIEDDPVYLWTGLYDVQFSSGDAALLKIDAGTGQTPVYQGVAALGSISSITDSSRGSQAVRLELSGVSLAETAARQIIFEGKTWQLRKGWIWSVYLNDNGQIIGEPIRLRSGRMLNMEYIRGADDGEAKITVDLEGYFAYDQEPLHSRYSEQKALDASDTSQDFVHELANLDPTSSDGPTGTGSNPYSSGGGDGGGGSSGALGRDSRGFR